MLMSDFLKACDEHIGPVIVVGGDCVIKEIRVHPDQIERAPRLWACERVDNAHPLVNTKLVPQTKDEQRTLKQSIFVWDDLSIDTMPPPEKKPTPEKKFVIESPRLLGFMQGICFISLLLTAAIVLSKYSNEVTKRVSKVQEIEWVLYRDQICAITEEDKKAGKLPYMCITPATKMDELVDNRSY
jgi:hypothetical protein